MRHLLLSISLLSACNGDRPRSAAPLAGSPTLTLRDSTILSEREGDFVGRPSPKFSVTDANVAVADEFSGKLRLFDRHGAAAGTFGRIGSGPGEFRVIGPATVLTDSFIVQSAAERKLEVFSRATGRSLGSVHYQGFVTGASLDGDRLWLANFDPISRRGVLVVDLAKLIQSAGREEGPPLASSFVPLPNEYATYPGLGLYNVASVAAWKDSALVGFGGSSVLTVITADGAVVKQVVVPARQRRGVRLTSLQPFRTLRISTKVAFEAISTLMDLWRLPDGSFVVWFQDNDVIAERSGVPDIDATAYLALLKADLSAACVDSPIRLPGGGRPRVTVSGGRVFVLDQDARNGTPRTLVRQYELSGTDCLWLPMTAPQA